MEAINALIGNIVRLIIDPLLLLLLVAALAYFIWGLALFILNGDSSEKRKKGRDAIIWGIVGLFIIVSVRGILEVLTNTFGI